MASNVISIIIPPPLLLHRLAPPLPPWPESLEIALKSSTVTQILIMRTRLSESCFTPAAFAAATMLMLASAQESRLALPRSSVAPAIDVKSSETALPATAADNQIKTTQPSETSPTSAGMDEILKLAAAGISNEVIKAFIQTSPVAFNPSASDIITLKAHAVPDDIVTALLKRGAELRGLTLQARANSAAAGPAGPQVPAPSQLRIPPGYAWPDPDSYDYFQYYYLYPRSLSSAYQTLYSYPPGFSYGYVRPVPFGPHL